MRTYDELYLGERWRPSVGDHTVEVRSPATEALVGRVREAAHGDVDAAVSEARRALDDGRWSSLPAAERGEVLGRIAKIVQGRATELAALISDEVGSPRRWAIGGQVGTAVGTLRVHRALASTYPWEETRPGLLGGEVRIHRPPVGVVGAIVPWNAPLFTAALKVAPALLAGCSVLLKPSPEAPLSAFALAEAAAEAGLPEGVLSVLPAGPAASEYLVRHPGVNKISFTGSTAVGRRIGELCGRDVRRCTLELGGKSAAILLDDVVLDTTTVAALVDGAMANSGQICIAQTRILAPRSRYTEAVDALADAVTALRVGDPTDPETDLGPVISAAARDRIEVLVESARNTARLVAGGGRPDGFDRGYYVRPTLLADVDPAAPIAQQEIFGPVAVVIPYDDEADAVRLANGTPYALAGSVWSADAERAAAVAARLEAGSVAVNSSAAMDLGSPFGGMRQSGLGREGGPEGISEYVEQQSVIVPAADERRR
ncbi:aldehyde dehydrogenase [Cryptosporangium aurantiacum]|uniref:Aldehyde dehydrogenase (NAD+) n=1 Tax=Cryptosporangium aurantiacum TaxID=134849 RepID=A0A1M7PLA6_9ACTN|nr:aldehyde dehydrogenase [Cryptosporangium aurantiacum]SHN18054.1 aldehyde dehydrogenase (NAD+) [Cryptosporangium aurantiacum]